MDQITKTAYFADFYVLPAMLMALTLFVGPSIGWDWCLVLVEGGTAWTFAEYWLHRSLHRVPVIKDWHDFHHDHPAAYNGPVSASLPTLGAVYLVAWLLLGSALAVAFCWGFVLGYLYYLHVHDMCHRHRIAPGHRLYAVKLRHALHHKAGIEANFGLSTTVWDLAFGTYVPVRMAE